MCKNAQTLQLHTAPQACRQACMALCRSRPWPCFRTCLHQWPCLALQLVQHAKQHLRGSRDRARGQGGWMGAAGEHTAASCVQLHEDARKSCACTTMVPPRHPPLPCHATRAHIHAKALCLLQLHGVKVLIARHACQLVAQLHNLSKLVCSWDRARELAAQTSQLQLWDARHSRQPLPAQPTSMQSGAVCPPQCAPATCGPTLRSPS